MRRRGPWLALAALLVLVPALRAQTAPPPAAGPVNPDAMTAEAKEKVLKGLEDVIENKAFVPNVDFKKWPDYVAKHKADLDKAETDTAFARELNRTLTEFGISHIRLRAPKAAQARVTTTTTSFGLRVKKDEAGLTVESVTPEGAAASAGISIGDKIVKIDGAPATDPAALRPETGKSLPVTVAGKDGKERVVTLEAKTVSTLRPNTLTWFGDDAAVLRIPTFTQGYIREDIEKLLREAAKAKYLTIDLRNNGGGAVRNLDHLLGMLIPTGTEYGVHVRRSVVDAYMKETNTKTVDTIAVAKWDKTKQVARKGLVDVFKGKIAVLINRGSASASEIVAAALHDTVGAQLVGSPSRGAVLASVYAKLEGGFELQYPVSDYVTIKGVRLEANPLQPDVTVDAKQETGKPDPVIEAAFEKLRKG